MSRPVNVRPARGRGPHSNSLLASSVAAEGGVRGAGAPAAVCGEGGAVGAGAAPAAVGRGAGAAFGGFGEDGAAAAVSGRVGGVGGGAGGVRGATGGGGVGGGAGEGGGGGGGAPSVTVPNVCAQYSVPFAAAAAPTPMARNDDPSMFPLCPGELSQLCITEAGEGWPYAMFSARPLPV
jgi:hypothetical protein